MMVYLAAGGRQRIVLGEAVLAHLDRHRQSRPGDTEAGGQLFARFVGNNVLVDVATGPRPTDGRGRFRFLPNRPAERREIGRMHRAGLHYVGDWHTHPETHPTPSGTDIRSMTDMFRRSRHDLAAFVMVIVGTAMPPAGLFVGLATAADVIRLEPAAAED